MLVIGSIWLDPISEIGRAVGICIVAEVAAKKLRNEWNNSHEINRSDKWMHAYVGCAMRRGFISAITAYMMATAQEILDFIQNASGQRAVADEEDIEATMYGYWNAYEGAIKRKKNIGCGIVTYVYEYIPTCERTCDILYNIPSDIKNVIIHPPEWIKPPKYTFDNILLSLIDKNSDIILKKAAKVIVKPTK